MRVPVSLVFAFMAVAVVLARKVDNPDYKPDCLIGQPNVYDPGESTKVMWFDIDLDLPPRQRYKQVARYFKNDMQAVFDVLGYFFTIIPGVPVWDILGDITKSALEKGMIMNPYRDEIEGIAEEIDVNIGHLAFLNLFYEMSRFCTSIVAQTADNKDLYHARNLDFGQLFVWDVGAQSWALSEALKKVTVNLNFFKNGNLLFKGSTLAGHVGVLTAMKPGGFSLSMNAKVQPDLFNVIRWYMDKEPGIQFVMYFERWLFENCDTYQCAREKIANVKLITGAYFILGGAKPGEGAVMVRNTTGLQFERNLFKDADSWFLLQTNYDTPYKDPLFIDNRQDPGEACMRKMGQKNVSMAGIYQVLSSKPTINKTTVHTIIMSVTKNYFESFIRTCPNPCWAF